jgi:hypothetical protein
VTQIHPPARDLGDRKGTQRWLEDPSVPACPKEGCHWDASTCPRHGRTTVFKSRTRNFVRTIAQHESPDSPDQ